MTAPVAGRTRRGGAGAPVLIWAVVLAVVLGAAACGVGRAGTEPVVRTAGGLVRGTETDSVQRFRGIRYAQPPVGALRWALPVPAAPWEGTVDATAPGPRCPQRGQLAGVRQSEDCLVLDVTTPTDRRPGERLPVVVWWHGGGFVTGSGAEYDARRLVEQGRVVVVTANYRLGVLGYLGLPGLAGSGSFGFADQLESVRWTRENIASFGGDPGNLTVAGQSAGGLAACALLSSPRLATLGVARVAVMSGPCSLDWPPGGVSPGSPAQRSFAPVESIDDAGGAAARTLGCPDLGQLACLRSRPVTELLTLNRSFDRLAFGTDLLPADPATALRDSGPLVPVLFGGTRDEARGFTRPVQRANPQAFTPASYPALLSAAFGPAATDVAQRYPLDRYGGSAGLTWSAVVTDRAWSCPTSRDVTSLSRRTQTFTYEFAVPDTDARSGDIPPGALHSADLPFLFDLGGRDALRGQDRQLADLMIGYWSSFARTGRPEAASGPPWNPVAAGTIPRPLQLSVQEVRPTDAYDAHRCAFWDGR